MKLLTILEQNQQQQVASLSFQICSLDTVAFAKRSRLKRTLLRALFVVSELAAMNQRFKIGLCYIRRIECFDLGRVIKQQAPN